MVDEETQESLNAINARLEGISRQIDAINQNIGILTTVQITTLINTTKVTEEKMLKVIEDFNENWAKKDAGSPKS